MEKWIKRKSLSVISIKNWIKRNEEEERERKRENLFVPKFWNRIGKKKVILSKEETVKNFKIEKIKQRSLFREKWLGCKKKKNRIEKKIQK